MELAPELCDRCRREARGREAVSVERKASRVNRLGSFPPRVCAYRLEPQFTSGRSFLPGGLFRTMLITPSCTPLSDQA